MYSVDQFLTEAKDARFAVIVVAVVLGWPSAQGLTIGEIARQLGCTPAALTRSIARFKALAGLDANGGGIRSGAVSDGDKPDQCNTSALH
jgi:hypothetical protein